MIVKAYYVVRGAEYVDGPEEHQDVVITTEHPLSSYGQPVVIDRGEVIPAQNFAPWLSRYHGLSDEEGALVAKANRLGGKDDIDPIEDRARFADFFADTKPEDS